MHPVIAKTFCGLTASYYFRQLFFGLIIGGLLLYLQIMGKHPLSAGFAAFIIISTLLYPYARFVYESIMDFIMGNNIFFVNLILMLIVKIVTMLLCWAFAVFIAPIGLGYLYFHHSRAEKKAMVEQNNDIENI